MDTDRQRTLFDDEFGRDQAAKRGEIGHTDPSLPNEAKPRLGGQNALLLDRLRQGPATNSELESIVGRVNSRVADVRRYLQRTEGTTIRSQAIDTAAGVYRYEIVAND